MMELGLVAFAVKRWENYNAELYIVNLVLTSWPRSGVKPLPEARLSNPGGTEGIFGGNDQLMKQTVFYFSR